MRPLQVCALAWRTDRKPAQIHVRPQHIVEGTQVEKYAHRSVLRRRMRILTVAVDVAKTPRALYESVDPAAVLAVLMHKILKASEVEGLGEARSLLQDWLVILVASYNRNLERERRTRLQAPAEVCCPWRTFVVRWTFLGRWAFLVRWTFDR
jgi:hypothetical protein